MAAKLEAGRHDLHAGRCNAPPGDDELARRRVDEPDALAASPPRRWRRRRRAPACPVAASWTRRDATTDDARSRNGAAHAIRCTDPARPARQPNSCRERGRPGPPARVADGRHGVSQSGPGGPGPGRLHRRLRPHPPGQADRLPQRVSGDRRPGRHGVHALPGVAIRDAAGWRSPHAAGRPPPHGLSPAGGRPPAAGARCPHPVAGGRLGSARGPAALSAAPVPTTAAAWRVPPRSRRRPSPRIRCCRARRSRPSESAAAARPAPGEPGWEGR